MAIRKITEYGTFLNYMLRDHLVCGILNKKVQCCFLQESEVSALDMALAAEAAAKDAKRLKEEETL